MTTEKQDVSLEIITGEVVRRYGLEAASLRPLGGFLNQAYACEQDGRPYIIRISLESGRTAEMVQGEVDWIHYLAAHGIPAAQAIPSLKDNLVEVVEIDEKRVPVVVFEKAAGEHVTSASAGWNADLFRKMGRLVGRMHTLTKTYVPTEAYRRPLWSQEMDDFAADYLYAVDEAVAEKFRQVRAYPEQLSTEKTAFGLIHADVHRGNFFVKDGELTLFDFDDSQYSWFAEDLAMCLFYAISPQIRTQAEQDFAQSFFNTFMEGYRRENTLDERWLREIPYFLKQRETNLYIVLNAVGYTQGENWSGLFMENRRQRILEDVPFVEIELN